MNNSPKPQQQAPQPEMGKNKLYHTVLFVISYDYGTECADSASADAPMQCMCVVRCVLCAVCATKK